MKKLLILAALLALLCASAAADQLPWPLTGLTFPNASQPLSLRSCYNSDQNVHPKVLYIPEGFAGHTYWMAYTPYDWAKVDHENPCIAYSDDGYRWTNIDANPIDTPPVNISGYYSDTHLVYRPDIGVLECWYRLADRGRHCEFIYRKTSTDGQHWSDRELLHDTLGKKVEAYCLSPAAVWDGSRYNIWYVTSLGAEPDSSSQFIQFCTSEDGLNWQDEHVIALNYRDGKGRDYRLWHIDVLQEPDVTIITAMCKGGKREMDQSGGRFWSLFVTTSTDNVTYTTPAVMMLGTRDWDQYMYRSSLVHTEQGYRLYYSALNNRNAHFIAISDPIQ